MLHQRCPKATPKMSKSPQSGGGQQPELYSKVVVAKSKSMGRLDITQTKDRWDRTLQLYNRVLHRMSTKTNVLVRNMGLGIGFIELIHKLIVANGPTQLEIVFAYFRPISDMVK